MERVTVFYKGTAPLYATALCSGADLYALLDKPLLVDPSERVLVPTGLFLEIPPGFEAQVRPRSGLAWHQGLTVMNAPGTIDADYRGEIKVLLVNLGKSPVEILSGDRIAQLVFQRVYRVDFKEGDPIPTQRGAKGFGSTGLS